MNTSGRLPITSRLPTLDSAHAANTEQAPGQTGDKNEQRTTSTHHRASSHGSVSKFLLRWPILVAQLIKATQDLAKTFNSPNFYTSNEENVEVNATGVRCPKANIVTTEIRQEDKSLLTVNLHANRVHLTCPSPAIQTGTKTSNTYLVGQSPIPAAAGQSDFHGSGCEKFLLQGLDSGAGTFQFVSPPRLGNPNRWSSRSIISQLQRELGHNSGLVLGGRYRVEGPLVPINNTRSNQQYRLTVTDVTDSANKQISIVLTQAGLNFEKKVLRAKEIREASEIMDNHRDPDKKKSPQTIEPMVVSHAGIGRSATLVVYREISARIKDGTIRKPAVLEQALEALILQGRSARGPLFVHSNEQVQELADTLLADLNQKVAAVDEVHDATGIEKERELGVEVVLHGNDAPVRSNVVPVSTTLSPQVVSQSTSKKNTRGRSFGRNTANPWGEPTQKRPEETKSDIHHCLNAQKKQATLNRKVDRDIGSSFSVARPTVDLGQLTFPPEIVGGLKIYTFGSAVLEMERLNTTLNKPKGGSHSVIGMSGDNNNCWWRACWVSALLRHATLSGEPNRLEKILIQKLGEDFREDAVKITTMIAAIRSKKGNGLGEVLTKGDKFGGRKLKLPGIEDDGAGEKICMHLAGQLLHKNVDIPYEDIQNRVYGGDMGESRDVAALCSGLGSDMVIFSVPSDTGQSLRDWANLTVCAQADSKFRLTQHNDADPQSLTNEVINAIDKTTVLMHSDPHFNVSIPNEFMEAARFST